MVKVTCYGQTDEFKSRNDAIKFYAECFANSEGSENERYANILFELWYTDKTEVSDGVD